MADMIKITLTKSVIGASPAQRRVVKALGLRKMQHAVEMPDTPQTRGAVEKVRHLLTVEKA
ncbi:MAG: 50S ribosomal protein L30 [Clostridiales Family XIII bacterium]|jgi:large subunit ribosomal protein L30|nr:50S ribosomal protein L30 [Clostridiales Family XIII bacterium]